MKIVAAIRLIDGSEHVSAFDGSLEDVKSTIATMIESNDLLELKNPRYGNLLGHDFIKAKHIISFSLSEYTE